MGLSLSLKLYKLQVRLYLAQGIYCSKYSIDSKNDSEQSTNSSHEATFRQQVMHFQLKAIWLLSGSHTAVTTGLHTIIN